MFSRLASELLFTNRLRFVLAIVVTGCAFHPAATLAEWRIAPSIGAGLQYDDNPALFTGSISGSSVNGYQLEADAAFAYSSPLTDFSLTPRVLLIRYDGFSALDSDDYFLNFNYDYAGQRSRFRMRGAFGDESTRTAERSGVDFQVDDPDEIPDDSSGRVLSTAHRQRVQFVPEWSHQMGQRSLLRIGANYVDVNYDDSILQFNTDYRQTSGKAGFKYNWSERSAFTLDAYYRENYFAVVDSDFSGYGATIGVNRSLSENARFIINVGIDNTEDEIGEKQANPIGTISLVRNMQTSRILASYRRTVTGSGAGELSVRDSVNLNYTYNFSEKFSIGTGLSAYQSQALAEEFVNFDERDYLQFRMLFSWNLTRVFAIDLDYAYTNIDRASPPSDADSNLVNLWFRYRAVR
jgi:hypothetical protein